MIEFQMEVEGLNLTHAAFLALKKELRAATEEVIDEVADIVVAEAKRQAPKRAANVPSKRPRDKVEIASTIMKERIRLGSSRGDEVRRGVRITFNDKKNTDQGTPIGLLVATGTKGGYPINPKPGNPHQRLFWHARSGREFTSPKGKRNVMFVAQRGRRAGQEQKTATDKTLVVAKRVPEHPGLKANPYLEIAFEKGDKAMKAIAESRFEKILAKYRTTSSYGGG